MKSINIPVLVCVFVVATSFSAFGQEWTAEEKELLEAVEGDWEYLKNGNVEALMVNFHDKMLALYGDNPTPLSKSQIEKGNKWIVDNYVPTFIKLKPIAINIVNNVANVFYLYKWESKNREISDSGRRMTTMIREDNKWVSIGSLSASCNKKAPCPYGW